MQNNTCAVRSAAGHPAEDFKRSKYIQVRYHHVKEKTISGGLHVEKIGKCDMAAEFLTKAMNSDQVTKTNAPVHLIDVTMPDNAE